MADVVNRNLGKLTVDFVDNTIVSDAKPIEPLRTMEFDGLRSEWITW
ncbi:MAG: hypothetical protein NTNFB02_08970 [Nitrospira sp.]